MSRRSFFALCLFFVLWPFVAKPQSGTEGARMKFDHVSYDFGDIPRRGGDLVHVFEFENDGSQPLVILRAITSCTCTKVSYSRRPVKPGERASIKVIYEPHKKEPGTFSKVIQIYTNAAEGRRILTVMGNSIDVKKL